MTDIQVRFRTTNGDLGPWLFNESTTIHGLREKLKADWPTEGPMAKEPPTSPADIRLILSGKILEANKSLRDYRRDMGELKPDTIVTMHMVVRPSQGQNNKNEKGPSSEPKEPPKGCGCVIS